MERNIETPPSDEERQNTTICHYQELINHASNIKQSLDKVKNNQINSLRQKYLYQLKKLQKYKQQYNRLKQISDKLPTMIDQSHNVVEEVKRTVFILMDTGFAKGKLSQIQKRVEDQKQKYNCQIEQIKKLKNQLKKQKQQYFNLERQSKRLNVEEEQRKNNRISQEISRKMKEVRSIKKNIKNNITPLKILAFQDISGEINNSFCLINYAKECLIKTGINFNKSNLKIQRKEQTNNLNTIISKNEKRIKNLKKQLLVGQIPNKKKLQKLQTLQDGYSQSCLVKFKQRQIEKQEFRKKNSQEVLQLIISQGKIEEFIKIIQEQKRPLVEAVERLRK